MKKMMAMAMAATMVMAAAVPAMALDDKTGTTLVTYGVDEAYVLTVPAEVNFAIGNLSYARTLEVSDARIANTNRLTVTVSSANDYNLVCDGSKIAYTVKEGDTAFTSMVVESGVVEKTANLTFATTEEAINAATKSGTHTDTLTFTGSIAAKA